MGLEPGYSFNDDDLCVGSWGVQLKGGATNVRLWKDLLKKLVKEQDM